MVLSSILVGAAWPAVLEQFSVKPNANEKEARSIESNIAATRQAYGLTDDKLDYIDYEGKTSLSADDVRRDDATVPNVRLLDPNILSETFTQRLQPKNFYGFPSKLDVDRYVVNNKLQEYIVAVRELNTDVAGVAAVLALVLITVWLLLVAGLPPLLQARRTEVQHAATNTTRTYAYPAPGGGPGSKPHAVTQVTSTGAVASA